LVLVVSLLARKNKFLSVFISLCNIYGSLILALYGKEGSISLRSIARRILLFPPSVALVIGLALLPWYYPLLAERLLQATAATLTPLVMTAIGFQINFRLKPALHSDLFRTSTL